MEESDVLEINKEEEENGTEINSEKDPQDVNPSNELVSEPVNEPGNSDICIENYLPTELTEEDEKTLTVGLPNVNCVEKILHKRKHTIVGIFVVVVNIINMPEADLFDLMAGPKIICLDLCSEMEKDTFRSRAGDKFSQIQVLLKALRLFLNSKSKLHFEHEFALLVLDDGATWVSDFTNNPRDILTLLEDLMCSNKPVSNTFDISQVFDIIMNNIEDTIVSNVISNYNRDPTENNDVTIIAFNLNYEESENLTDKYTHLIQTLALDPNSPVMITATKRIPQRRYDKPGLVKISFKNTEQKIKILRKKMNLKKSQDFSNVYLKSSKSYVERRIESNAKATLRAPPNPGSLRVNTNGLILSQQRNDLSADNVPQ
ncbi:hypothetical protein LOTGIDRAFT_162630 [Lottia gigantea]|uniref:BRISC and BRCA1-A complex member 1 n=1 Tax=Lottia gigantea TaxID=225164 RepID=V4AG10_LOTGI|nr:hypothetical protein LOTGIDRAFT_162630 [Lottia gigantea]ESO92326.1 hypothetical protein LOTGIDRAFT_162630 [Lottia gigantea]